MPRHGAADCLWRTYLLFGESSILIFPTCAASIFVLHTKLLANFSTYGHSTISYASAWCRVFVMYPGFSFLGDDEPKLNGFLNRREVHTANMA